MKTYTNLLNYVWEKKQQVDNCMKTYAKLLIYQSPIKNEENGIEMYHN